MKYQNIAQVVFNEPWAILPTKFLAITAFMAVKIKGGDIDPEEIEAIMGAAARGSQASRSGAVAVLPLRGVMAQRMNMMEAMSGGTSTEGFGKAVKEAAANPEIGGIVLDIDSPGGSVFGVGELANIVAEANTQKPVVAMVNSLAASAAYWVASQAREIIITPGGQAGSIGVFTAHDDVSAMLEAEGHNVTLISAGKKKVDGNPFGPLSDEVRSDMQARVNAYYSQFTAAVAKGRGVTVKDVREGFGEGAVVGAVEAVRTGLVDRIGTLDMAIQKAGGRQGFQAGRVHEMAVNIGMIAEDAEEIGEEAATAELIRNRPETPDQDDTDARRRRSRLNQLTCP